MIILFSHDILYILMATLKLNAFNGIFAKFIKKTKWETFSISDCKYKIAECERVTRNHAKIIAGRRAVLAIGLLYKQLSFTSLALVPLWI